MPYAGYIGFGVEISDDTRTSADSGLQELIAGGAAAGFEPGGLDRHGPLYQATPYANRTMPEQGDFVYPTNVFPTTSQPTFSAAPSAYPGLAPGANSVDTAASVSWQPATGALYGSDGSPAVSTGSGASVFGFASQQTTPNPYAGGYVSPTALQNAPQSGFEVYSWPRPGDGTVTLGTPNPGTLPSPALQNFEMLAVSPEGAFSDSDPAMYGEVEGWQQQQQQQQQHQQPNQGMHVETAETPRHKRAKKSIDEQTAPSLSTQAGTASKAPKPSASASASGKAKLRSASRASKNTQHRPEETPQERKSRNSHNLVEKQYRNRLNMQFEILMNTLPESMRSAPAVGWGRGRARREGTRMAKAEAEGREEGGPAPRCTERLMSARDG
ncbi:hypothetical protein NEMBOFW57_000535 [Staphylotrichum longicolle]|uniref:BHLH domain-containing protein n=1 Tax=Staphylotrichum longicolle TaxID=669026 RepID=A0AAD4EZV4_9PEZI|nr:hypothetical protein NEMBOFW57_000535 [Staphylotrichum longicolle]